MKSAAGWRIGSSPAEAWGVSAQPSAGSVEWLARVGTRRLRPKVFCAAIVLLPCLLLFLAFPIARTEEFALRSQDLYLTNLGYGLTLDHAKCDVMIYGDSSALTGIDPAVIEQQTGLKTCNIAEYEGVFELYRLLIPDEVLRRNDPPRFLVMAFCPWNLAPYDDWAKSTTYEAILLRLRFLPNLKTAFVLAEHPSQTFDFLTRTLRMAVTAPAHAEMTSETARYRQDHQGFMPRPGERMADCSSFSDRLRAPDARWIEEMRRRYAVKGTRVIIDVTPLPSCAESFGYYAEQLRGRTDNQLEPWPPQRFNGSGHFMPLGATKFSELIARQIRDAVRVN